MNTWIIINEIKHIYWLFFWIKIRLLFRMRWNMACIIARDARISIKQWTNECGHQRNRHYIDGIMRSMNKNKFGLYLLHLKITEKLENWWACQTSEHFLFFWWWADKTMHINQFRFSVFAWWSKNNKSNAKYQSIRMDRMEIKLDVIGLWYV